MHKIPMKISIAFFFLIYCTTIISTQHEHDAAICIAADKKSFASLLQLIASLQQHALQDIDEIAVFDLGLTNNQRMIVSHATKVAVYDLPLIHPALKNDSPERTLKYYACKPVVIKQMLDAYSSILYLDPVYMIKQSLAPLFEYIKEHGSLLLDDGHGVMKSCQGFSRALYETYVMPIYEVSKYDLYETSSTSEDLFPIDCNQLVVNTYAHRCHCTMMPTSWINTYLQYSHVPDSEYIKKHLLLEKREKDHSSSYPYITGDTFRAYAHFILDKENNFFPACDVADGDTIFVQTDYLEEFFTYYHPAIQVRYILITHNGLLEQPEQFSSYLNDQKLIAWFGKNLTLQHPKAICIPLGLANKWLTHGNKELFDEMVQVVHKNMLSKKQLLYINFDIATYSDERSKAFEIVSKKPFCRMLKKKPYRSYLKDLAESKFVVSPRGSGLDCYRIWESLLLGSYPIVKTSALDRLFEDLPVVIVNDWDEITERLLQQKYEEFSQKNYDFSKLYMPYWLNLIERYKDDFLSLKSGARSKGA